MACAARTGAGCSCCDRLTDLKPLRLSCLQTSNRPFVNLPLGIFWGHVERLWHVVSPQQQCWACSSETWERSTRLNKCGWLISTAPIFNTGPQTPWPRVISRSVATPFFKSRSPCQHLLDYGVTVTATGRLGSRTYGKVSQLDKPSSPAHVPTQSMNKHLFRQNTLTRFTASLCRAAASGRRFTSRVHSPLYDRLPLCLCVKSNWGKVHEKELVLCNIT